MRSVRCHVLIGSTLIASWLGMQAVHESGHVLGAHLTGGRVARVVLHPLTISRTDLSHNPRPLLVVWAGPAVGVLLPLVLWGVAAGLRLPGAFVLRLEKRAGDESTVEAAQRGGSQRRRPPHV